MKSHSQYNKRLHRPLWIFFHCCCLCHYDVGYWHWSITPCIQQNSNNQQAVISYVKFTLVQPFSHHKKIQPFSWQLGLASWSSSYFYIVIIALTNQVYWVVQTYNFVWNQIMLLKFNVILHSCRKTNQWQIYHITFNCTSILNTIEQVNARMLAFMYSTKIVHK